MITFNNIVERFEDFATSHFFIKSFSFGSPDDVDLAKFTEFPLMHLVYTGATYDSGTKTYNIEVYILDVPADKNDKVERQREVVSDAEQCAEDILADIRMGGNIFTFAQDYEVVNATTTPLEEETKNVLSGVLLDLSVAIPYEWDACNAPIDGVSPEGGDEPSYARRGFLRMLTLDGSTDVLSVRTIKVNNGTLTDDGEGVVTLDTGGVDTLEALTDVTIANLQDHDVLKYNRGQTRWENVDWLLVLYTEFRSGTSTIQNNGAATDSALELTVTQAKLKAGITGVEITETSPGDIDLIVATDAAGTTAYTAINIDGSTTASEADINLFGDVYIHDEANGTKALLSHSSTFNTTLTLPDKSGTLARTVDIPNVPVDSVNGQTGVVVLVTTDIDEGTNLYYTEARVAANSAVAANTLKVGITTQQAADITANNAKVGITTQQADDITANNAKVGITQTQADDITANNAKVGITPTQAGEITANTAKVGVIAGGTSGQALVKASGTDYDLEWADAASGVQYHERFATDAETFRSGATATTELYYTAKADGDGLAQSASSDTPTAGKIIKRKIYYSEAAFADPDTGTWIEFTPAPADDASFATVKAALLEYLKARTGGTVPISLKQTWEEIQPSTYLLDQSYGSGAAAAYSTRQLRFAQTDCMVIRRASDSTTTTIGFDGSGNIDEAAIETFCTGTTCTVQTWKDQSGNSFDFSESNANIQPVIYDSGEIFKTNGKPSINFTTSDIRLTNTNSIVDSPSNMWVSWVARRDSANEQDVNRGLFDTFGDRTVFDTSTEGWLYDGNYSGNPFNYNNLRRNAFLDLQTGAGNASAYLDGVLWDTDTYTASAIKTTSYLGFGGSGYMKGDVQEFIIWTDNQSSNRTSIESNVGDYFTQNTPLLDTYSGAAAAYSLRLLDSTYTGSAIRVRRSSDNTEQDIGFNVFGELDTVSLASFCGSSNGFVKTWYDQSGNSNDATQSTTSQMPKIYDGTTGVITENGKPAVYFDGDPNSLHSSSSISHTNSTMLVVCSVDNVTHGTYDPTIFRIGDGSTKENDLRFMYGTSNRSNVIFRREQNNVVNSLSYTNSNMISQNLTFNVVSSSNLQSFMNGSSQGTQANSPTAMTSSSVDIGAVVDSTANVQIHAKIQEAIFYTVDQDSAGNRTNIESNIATFYGITL